MIPLLRFQDIQWVSFASDGDHRAAMVCAILSKKGEFYFVCILALFCFHELDGAITCSDFFGTPRRGEGW